MRIQKAQKQNNRLSPSLLKKSLAGFRACFCDFQKKNGSKSKLTTSNLACFSNRYFYTDYICFYKD
nr:MAG TPA: hypothetical protein [Caudoviricetes sp.]